MNKNIAYNLKVKSDLERHFRMNMDNLMKFEPGRLANTFLCVECGKFVTSKVVEFYKGDVAKVKCYECQAKNGK